ncbi:death on curing protein [Ruminococcaceae bacterium YAD3003]|nr:death on curing protein [Ruminococcaceae bacterium YAD3003]
MITLTKDQIIMLHEAIYERYGGALGVLNEGMLDSALQAPFQTFGGEELYPETKDKIIRLAYGLIKNHSFRDGNKRIGALVLLTLLEINGYHVNASNEEFVDIIMGIAASEKDDEDLKKWVEKHIGS